MVNARIGRRHRAQAFVEKIRSIIFMGTPHKGSWLADWMKTPAKLLAIVKSTNLSLLDVLETETETLRTLHRQFISLISAVLLDDQQNIELFSFYETLPTWGCMIVNTDSARIEEAENISTRKTHSGLTKFHNTIKLGDDPMFDSFVEHLSGVVLGTHT
ncbi:hypothetical protein B7494_g3488 [Chlorociboria aeruginascens]|nr:hypothetical protein B7494_g3488 [Chlorociboria aeruginascens]